MFLNKPSVFVCGSFMGWSLFQIKILDFLICSVNHNKVYDSTWVGVSIKELKSFIGYKSHSYDALYDSISDLFNKPLICNILGKCNKTSKGSAIRVLSEKVRRDRNFLFFNLTEGFIVTIQLTNMYSRLEHTDWCSVNSLFTYVFGQLICDFSKVGSLKISEEHLRIITGLGSKYSASDLVHYKLKPAMAHLKKLGCKVKLHSFDSGFYKFNIALSSKEEISSKIVSIDSVPKYHVVTQHTVCQKI